MSETLCNNEGSDEEAMEDSDVWDDSMLIKAYNKAVDMAKEKIAKKLSLENGTGSPKEASGTTPKSTPVKKSEKTPKSSSNPTKEWKAGHHCRAVFSEDGLEYEAVILEVYPWKGTCQVMYLGYNNDEEVNLADLKQSKGEKARKSQEMEAMNSFSKNQGDYRQMNGVAPRHHPPEMRGSYGGGDLGVIPPPPPPNVMAHFPKDESDALSAMLMAWYMSGYHTGYYQGLTRSKCSECSNGETTSRLN